MMRFRSGLLVAAGITFAASIAAVSAAGPARAAQARPAQTPPRPGQIPVADGQRLAGQVFKNVQVLKDVTVDDFMTLMGLMTAAVGGDCADCHKDAGTERVDWPFDTPRKIAARRMSAMVMAINRDHFAGRQVVSCWSCHRGRTRPILTPTLEHVY